MPFSHTILDILFLLSVSITWLMIVYQFFLMVAGYRYRTKITAEQREIEASEMKFVPVSVMIPAHNEGLVIERTLDRLSKLDYPSHLIEIVVVNDASSDQTAQIVQQRSDKDPRIKLLNLPGKSGHGKAYALNAGLRECSHDIVAIYDADNNPQPDSIQILVSHLQRDDSLAAVIGKFRTINRSKNWLTRFINIETMAFQWILQAGRFQASKVTILPGTNYIIKKSVLEECGGWDEKAITEDSEISVRIYQLGYKIKFVPLSVTWEQEPEKLSTWIRQRTRWVRGNNYVLKKFAPETLKFKSKFLFMEFIYLFALYYLFLIAIVLSHVLFIMSSLGIVALNIAGPYFGVWVSAFLLFVLEIVVVLSYEREDSLTNIIFTVFMYFTYCQLWLYVVFKALSMDMRRYKVGVWDKTERFHVLETSEQEISRFGK
ncbi:glycosyltransferase family 2 protein [candidate division KSB1 bacterium]|nr:glycosyltransferase family 2 protein [candidate division KSB1 bacterium]